MEIKAPIQTQPQGMLGFLQLKNLGQNPTEFPRTLQPVLEAFEWYLQTNMESQQFAIAAFTTTGVKAITTIPEGEYWLVDAIDVVLTQDVGGAVEYNIGYAYGGFGLTRSLSEPKSFAIAGGANTITFMPRDQRPIFMPPGSLIRIFVRSVTVGVTTGVALIRFKRLPV